MSWGNLSSFTTPSGFGFWSIIFVLLSIFGYVIGTALRKRAWLKLGEPHLIKQLIGNQSKVLIIVRPILVVTALILMLFAFAKPQTTGKTIHLKSKGLDMVVALDFSKSMNVRDMHGSRLEHAKREMNKLIYSHGGDRLGLIAFAGTSMSYPLTTDYESAKMFWEDLRPEDMPLGGTAIGKALNAAKDLLVEVRDPKSDQAQIIILLSDGEDLVSKPLLVASELHKLGIKVFTIGIGSTEESLIPMMTETGKTSGYMKYGEKYIRSRLDSSLLQKISDITGGTYYHATKEDFGTQQVLKAIKDLKRAEGKKRKINEKKEEFHWFLFPALILLLLEFMILGNSVIFTRKKEKP
jgi:Ca-activated chloride channel homolog